MNIKLGDTTYTGVDTIQCKNADDESQYVSFKYSAAHTGTVTIGNTWGHATRTSFSEIPNLYTGWEYGTITVSSYDPETSTRLSGIGVPVYVNDTDEFHMDIDKNGTKVPF